MVTVDALEKLGWFVTAEGIELVKEQAEEPVETIDQWVRAAQDVDLRDLVDKGFRKGDLTKLDALPSPLVLQVLQIQNVTMPSIHQNIETPRLLRFTFTDGSKKKWIGAEILGRVDGLSIKTPPGTKVLVTQPIAIREQLLVLGKGMIKVLGGEVLDLVQAWKAGKQFIQRSKNTAETDDIPPPFVPFKVKPTAAPAHAAPQDASAPSAHTGKGSGKKGGDKDTKQSSKKGTNDKKDGLTGDHDKKLSGKGGVRDKSSKGKDSKAKNDQDKRAKDKNGTDKRVKDKDAKKKESKAGIEPTVSTSTGDKKDTRGANSKKPSKKPQQDQQARKDPLPRDAGALSSDVPSTGDKKKSKQHDKAPKKPLNQEPQAQDAQDRPSAQNQPKKKNERSRKKGGDDRPPKQTDQQQDKKPTQPRSRVSNEKDASSASSSVLSASAPAFNPAQANFTPRQPDARKDASSSSSTPSSTRGGRGGGARGGGRGRGRGNTRSDRQNAPSGAS